MATETKGASVAESDLQLANDLRRRKSALTASDVANILGISEQTVYKLAKRVGGIPALRFGTTVRFDPQQLADWLSARQTKGHHA